VSSQQEIIRAFIELQLFHLSPAGAPLIDDPVAVAREALAYIGTLPTIVQQVFHLVTDHIDQAAQHQRKKGFPDLSLKEREALLDDLWGDSLWHDLVSMLAKIGWLVIHAREPARSRVGFSIELSRPPRPPADVPEPQRADLRKKYDVCVVGSGAGGAVMASRLAAEGKSVVVIDEGRWISPRNYPQRDDQALMAMYRNAGVQPALPTLDAILKPGGASFMTVLQARVFGGGPAINNAIHFPISKDRAGEWTRDYDFPVSWTDFATRLARVKADLGVSTQETEKGTGERSRIFQRGATGLGLPAQFLETAVHDCAGCGGCNVGCAFGLKTGGLHNKRPATEPMSYLMRALSEPGAAFAPQVQATRLKHGLFGRRISGLAARDRRAEKDVEIEARMFVLSAGPIAGSKLLRQSFIQIASPVGRHIAANIVMPVFALMPQDIAGTPNPGLEMCFYVAQDGRLLESWFHYPGSLTTAIPEWLAPHVRIMTSYRRLTACGVVVPSGNRGLLNFGGDLVLTLSDDELKRMVAGVLSAADLYFQAGAIEVIPATSRPLYFRRDTLDADKRLFRQSIRGPADLTLGTAHPQGGNAIGRHASRSVVGPGFSAYDFDNLFVADASLFPAGCGVNPQMTAMALAHLAADRVLTALP
jgi:choline dehydrogenase-like flavoprotein